MSEIRESKTAGPNYAVEKPDMPGVWLNEIEAPTAVQARTPSRGQHSEVFIVRHPPPLNLPLSGAQSNDEIQQLMIDNLTPIARLPSGELAYSVVEMLVRLEPSVVSSIDSKALEGLETISEMARMFEHLSVLQCNPEG